MWHHVHRLDADSSARMRSFGNTLFLRALTEGENLSTLHRQSTGETSSREAAAASSELASMTEEDMQDFFQQTLLPMFKGGIFPRPVNGEHKEWTWTAAVWEDPLIVCCRTSVSCTMSLLLTLTGIWFSRW